MAPVEGKLHGTISLPNFLPSVLPGSTPKSWGISQDRFGKLNSTVPRPGYMSSFRGPWECIPDSEIFSSFQLDAIFKTAFYLYIGIKMHIHKDLWKHFTIVLGDVGLSVREALQTNIYSPWSYRGDPSPCHFQKDPGKENWIQNVKVLLHFPPPPFKPKAAHNI